jgi:hypothetical protein
MAQSPLTPFPGEQNIMGDPLPRLSHPGRHEIAPFLIMLGFFMGFGRGLRFIGFIEKKATGIRRALQDIEAQIAGLLDRMTMVGGTGADKFVNMFWFYIDGDTGNDHGAIPLLIAITKAGCLRRLDMKIIPRSKRKGSVHYSVVVGLK